MFDEGAYERESQEWGHELREQDPAKCNHRSVHKSDSTDDSFEKWNLRTVDAHLWLRVVIVKVIVGAVVRVVGFVQQLDRQRPAERLWNERVLDGKRKSEGHVRVGPQEFKCEKAGQRFSKNEKKGKEYFAHCVNVLLCSVYPYLKHDEDG